MSDSENSRSTEQSTMRKLYRSTRLKVIAGVCGGVSEYFNVDVVIVRLLWVLMTIFGGSGIIAYILCWIMIPEGTGEQPTSSKPAPGALWVGVVLVIIGFITLFTWSGWQVCMFPLSIHTSIFPGILVLIGIGLLLGWLLSRTRYRSDHNAGETTSSESDVPHEPARFYRSRDLRVISGICGGAGKHFNLDPTIIRILWILFALASLGTAALLYVILIFAIPEEPFDGELNGSK